MATKKRKTKARRPKPPPPKLKIQKKRKSQAGSAGATVASYEAEIQKNEMVKRHFRGILKDPCPACHQLITLTQAAQEMELDKSLLWKWANREGSVTTEHNLQKVEAWVKEKQGVGSPSSL